MSTAEATRIAIGALTIAGVMVAACLLVGVLAGLLLRASRRE